MPDVSLKNQATSSAPKDYTLPGSQEFVLKAITASIDGTSAAGAFVPVFELVSPGGDVMIAATAPVMSAGASADISWFPGLGGGGSGGSGMAKLFDSGYLAAPAPSLDTLTDGIAPGFSCLQVVAYLRSDYVASSDDNVIMRINGDPSSVYWVNRIQNNGATITGVSSATGQTSANMGDVPTNKVSDAHIFGSFWMIIPAYDVSPNYKVGTAESTTVPTSLDVQMQQRHGFTYQQGNAINRIALTPGGGSNWVAGSRMIVYGMG